MINAKHLVGSGRVLLLAFGMLGQGLCAVLAGEEQAVGRAIYQRLCVECHGENGEGVAEKYEHALVGDWSVERLTRKIERTMPEDDPDKCVGEDAAAVARYIYDAFYSREARLRNQTARVELMRLTNRQYENSVADLIRHFTGGKRMVDAVGGLRGTYYKARNFRRDGKVHERVDAQVQFEFGDGSPDPEAIPAEEFSMQWRGSVIPDETGDYEFILKTPNGARLWVNNTDQALIDAWEATGEEAEHRATVRLLGGRAYPIELDYFKYKDKTASISLQWKAPHRPQEVIPARNLSPETVSSTFVVRTPFPPDDSSVGYERGVAVSKAWLEATTRAAIEAANFVVRELNALSGTKADDADRAAKIESCCVGVVETAFRRPLTELQRRVFVENHFQSADTPEEAVKRVVMLALQSPRFLYLGIEEEPDDYVAAWRLSFGLWDSIPDEELLKAAARGELREPEQVAAEARRMLKDPRTKAKIQYFLHQWLQMHHVEDLSKDGTVYPGFTPAVIADLRTSLNLFLEEAVWNGGSDYRELLLADYTYMNERLAEFYGVELPDDNGFVKVRWEPDQRSGVLTHPYLLAAFSYQKTTSPIHRGVFLTRNIVGRALKPPPVAVEFNESEFSPEMTMREKVAELTRPQACQSCHSVINPLGFSLEHFDAVGRYRLTEGNRPIDPVSDYTTDDGETIRLTGPRDVAQFAVRSTQAQNSFIEQLFHQIVKEPILAYGRGVLDELRDSFVASNFNLKELLVEIVKVSALHGRETDKLTSL